MDLRRRALVIIWLRRKRNVSVYFPVKLVLSNAKGIYSYLLCNDLTKLYRELIMKPLEKVTRFLPMGPLLES